MPPDYKKIFLELDADGCWETPEPFDESALRQKIIGFVEDFKELVSPGERIELADRVQDASFYCDICVESTATESKPALNIIAVKFSNFGFLANLSKNDWVSGRQQKILDMLHLHGFLNVPWDELEQPYDGVIPEKEKIGLWWVRFFGYF